MKLFTREQFALLLLNGQRMIDDPDNFDPEPVVKIFNPVGAGTWLLVSVDPENPDLAYGLCDLGMESPEIGYVSIEELTNIKGPLKLGLERDKSWLPIQSLSQYAADARIKRCIDV